MSNQVPLAFISFHDATRIATHVLVEVSQSHNPHDNDRTKRELVSQPFCLGLDENGKAVLPGEGIGGVFEFSVQPVICSSDVIQERIGVPATFRPRGGSFVQWAEVVTTGTLIPRTSVRRVGCCPPHVTDSKPAALPEEVSYGTFQYSDMEDGEAIAIDVTIYGVYEGDDGPVEGPWLYSARVQNHAASPPIADIMDVTRVDFLPYKLGPTVVPYGAPVTRIATPGFFLESVSGWTEGTPANPVNSASVVEVEPVVVPGEQGVFEMTPEPRREPSRRAKTPERPPVELPKGSQPR